MPVPTSRGRNHAAPNSAGSPRRVNDVEILAPAATNRTSDKSARTTPMPAHAPLIAAIKGLRRSTRSVNGRRSVAATRRLRDLRKELHVHSRAEATTGTGEHHRAHVRVVVGAVDELEEPRVHRPRPRVHSLRAVQRDRGDVVAHVPAHEVVVGAVGHRGTVCSAACPTPNAPTPKCRMRARSTDWVGDRLPGTGSFSVERIGQGAGIANALYLIERDGHAWVLRRPPVVKNDPSAGNTVREWRILRCLEGTAVPHPTAHLLCEDPDVIGATFMIMDRVVGFTPGFELPAPFDADSQLRHGMAMAYVDGIVELSKVDWRAGGLDGLGKPDGFLERQVPRWLAQLDRYRTRDLPELGFVCDWLEANRPDDEPRRDPARRLQPVQRDGRARPTRAPRRDRRLGHRHHRRPVARHRAPAGAVDRAR